LGIDKAHRTFSSPELFYSPGGGNTVSFMLREIFTIPPGYLISKRKMVRVLSLSVLALLLEGLSVSYIFHQNQNLRVAIRVDLPNISTLTNKSAESRAEIIGVSVGTAFFPLFAIPIFALAGRVRRAARRSAVHSLEEVRTKDTRAPLLFLRSFYDDQVNAVR
jgi:hypothetical protein